MGIFFTSSKPAVPTTNTAFKEALLIDPKTITAIDQEAAHRTVQLSQALSPSFNAWRFGGAVVIAGALLLVAIWTGRHDLPDISKGLMDAFSGFSGIVLGLLGGEAQKSSSSG
jgi:hypothetical protein